MKDHSREKCKCPYCETELSKKCMGPVFCTPCSIEFATCKTCGQIFNRELEKCPKCGRKNG